MHNVGFTGHEGEFRKQAAWAEPRHQFTSATLNKSSGELAAGTS